ncbi:MAG: DUF389 domain-containing protein [Allobranchiibius sp.]
MLVHLDLNVPADLSDQVREALLETDTVTNVVVLSGASLRPEGDVYTADVAREDANALLARLHALGLAKRGGIVLSQPTGTPFAAARQIDRAATGDPDDAVVWDVLQEQAYNAARPTLSYQIFLFLAVALASVAVITDSSILVVGSMVIGPEFATVAAVCTGLAMRDLKLAGRSVLVLLLTFASAALLVALLALLARSAGLLSPDAVTRPRPQTQFIWQPTTWSFVVAVLAGAAGVLALSVEKAQAMVGVFISVTTVPAAGSFALALGLWVPGEMGGAATQLGINFVGMVAAGTLTLMVQRHAWHHLQRITKPFFRRGRA